MKDTANFYFAKVVTMHVENGFVLGGRFIGYLKFRPFIYLTHGSTNLKISGPHVSQFASVYHYRNTPTTTTCNKFYQTYCQSGDDD